MAQNKESKGEELRQSYFNLIPMLKHTFHTLSQTLLTLLLPLSFLLLSKFTSSASSSTPSPLYSILWILVSSLSVSSLLYSITGHQHRPWPATAWATVCTFQVCISIGTETTISKGAKPLVPTELTSLMWIERSVFFLGLYGTMLHWTRTFVKPVVDDAVYGVEVQERGFSRVAIGLAFGTLWLWLLRDEVEPLVMAAGKGGMMDGFVGWDAFVLWLVSYSTVVIGMVRVVEIVFWVGGNLLWFLCCRGEADVVPVSHDSSSTDELALLL